MPLTDKEQLLNEAEYHLKNYGDQGGCHPPRPTASGGLMTTSSISIQCNSSDDTIAKFNNNNCFIFHSK